MSSQPLRFLSIELLSFQQNLISAGIFGNPKFNSSFSIGKGVFEIGHFLTAVITFLSIAAAIYFFVVKPYQKMRGPQAPAGPSEVDLLTEIRDSLKAR